MISALPLPSEPQIEGARPRVNPLVRDLGVTSAAQIAAFATTMIVTSLLGRLVGVLALGEYLLMRRVYAWMITIVLLGMQVALPRYAAQAAGRDVTKEKAAKYFLGAALSLSVVSVAMAIVLRLGAAWFSRWLFGSSQYIHLITPLAIMLCGYALHYAVFGYYRGVLLMMHANALLFANFCLAPLLSVLFLYRSASVAKMLSWTGLCVAAISFLFSIPIIRNEVHKGSLHFAKELSQLLKYGFSRIPGDFGAGAIFALGPIIAAHFMPVPQTAPLLLGTSVLMALSVTATPLGVILLSKVSMMLAQDRKDAVRQHLEHLLLSLRDITVLACLQVIIFADVLIRFWVGPKFLSGIGVIRIAACGIPFYLFYVTFRTVVDAGSEKAYNARNLVCTLCMFFVLNGAVIAVVPVDHMLDGFACGLLISIVILAWLTARSICHLYQVQVRWRSSAVPILLALTFSAASLGLHWAMGFRTGILSLLVIEGVLWASYIWILTRRGSAWIPFLFRTAFPNRRAFS